MMGERKRYGNIKEIALHPRLETQIIIYRRGDIEFIFEGEWIFCRAEIEGRQTVCCSRQKECFRSSIQTLEESAYHLVYWEPTVWRSGGGKLKWRSRQRSDEEGCQSPAESRLLPVSNRGTTEGVIKESDEICVFEIILQEMWEMDWELRWVWKQRNKLKDRVITWIVLSGDDEDLDWSCDCKTSI